MPANRSVKKLIALMLVAGAAAGAVEVSTQASGARAGNTTGASQGYPNAVPPTLRPATSSDLAAVRQAEAWEAQGFYYDPPATARWSDAETNAYASSAK
jgi:hypothetical protein